MATGLGYAVAVSSAMSARAMQTNTKLGEKGASPQDTATSAMPSINSRRGPNLSASRPISGADSQRSAVPSRDEHAAVETPRIRWDVRRREAGSATSKGRRTPPITAKLNRPRQYFQRLSQRFHSWTATSALFERVFTCCQLRRNPLLISERTPSR